MAFERYQISLKAILRRDDGRILGLNGKIGRSFEGFYDLPGGRIEDAEFALPLDNILRRELREELGPEIAFTVSDQPVALGRHWSREGIPVFYVFFEALIDNPDIIPVVSHEHEGWAWLDLSAQPLEKLFVSGILEGVKGWYTARHET